MVANSATNLNAWSEDLDRIITAYNSTSHRTIGFPPAVSLYSWICSDLDSVPEAYRPLLENYLRKYMDWNSMKLDIHDLVTASFSFSLHSPRAPDSGL